MDDRVEDGACRDDVVGSRRPGERGVTTPPVPSAAVAAVGRDELRWIPRPGIGEARWGGGPVVHGARAVWRRLGWGPNRVVPCRDARGGSARLLVHHEPTGVVLSASAAGPLLLTSRQARRLQAVLRRAGTDDDRRTGRRHRPQVGR